MYVTRSGPDPRALALCRHDSLANSFTDAEGDMAELLTHQLLGETELTQAALLLNFRKMTHIRSKVTK